jgi:hypothetical protein
VPFRKPDASDGGAATYEEAVAAAERAAGVSLQIVGAEWARAWMRTLRGQPAWPSTSSATSRGARASRDSRENKKSDAESIWTLLDVPSHATLEEIRAAFKRRALALHPDHGGDPATFRRLVRAYEEAQRRARRPRRKNAPR